MFCFYFLIGFYFRLKYLTNVIKPILSTLLAVLLDSFQELIGESKRNSFHVLCSLICHEHTLSGV